MISKFMFEVWQCVIYVAEQNVNVSSNNEPQILFYS